MAHTHDTEISKSQLNLDQPIVYRVIQSFLTVINFSYDFSQPSNELLLKGQVLCPLHSSGPNCLHLNTHLHLTALCLPQNTNM